MAKRGQDCLFDYSRNPIEHLLTGDVQDDPWFAGHCVKWAAEFTRKLKRSSVIKGASYTSTPKMVRGPLVKFHGNNVQLKIEFKKAPPIDINVFARAQTAHMARTVAFGESLERLGFRLAKRIFAPEGSVALAIRPAVLDIKTSNGAFFHSSPVKGLRAGLCELFERDALLTNWYAGHELPVCETELEDLDRAKNAFALLGWRLREHCWAHDKGLATVVWISLTREKLDRDGWNFFFGGGAGLTRREATVRALGEVIENYDECHDRPIDNSGRVPLSALRGSPLARLVVYQRPSYVSGFLQRLGKEKRFRGKDFEGSETDFVLDALERNKDLRVTPLPVPASIRDHVYCAKLSCAGLQDADWDIPALFNYARIASKYGTKKNRVCLTPHPVP